MPAQKNLATAAKFYMRTIAQPVVVEIVIVLVVIVAWKKPFIVRGGPRQRMRRGRGVLFGGAAKAARFRDAASALAPASAFGDGAMWKANGSWSRNWKKGGGHACV